MPERVKKRLAVLRPMNMTQTGWFIVQSQAERTQEQNYRDAYNKLQSYIDEACVPLKKRKWKPFEESEVQKGHRVH